MKLLKVFLSFLFFLTLVEAGTRLYFFFRAEKRIGLMSLGAVEEEQWKGLPYYIPLRSGRVQRFYHNGELFMDVPFSIDEKSRRVSLPPAQDPSTYLVFIGCSYTFGTGVRDNETLPSQVQKKIPNVRVYNYGVGAASPLEIYLRLKNIAHGELSENNGRVIYTYFRDHLQRHLWTPQFIGSWGYTKNVYEKDGESYRRLGRYSQVHPIKTFVYKLFYRSEIFRLTHGFFGENFTDTDLSSFASLIGEIDRESLRISGKHLVFLVWPGSPLGKLKTKLIDLGVTVIDYSQLDLQQLTGGKDKILIDRHPTPESFNVISDLLVKDLSQLSD